MYETLAARGIALSPKPFALGLRVEHPQALIDNIQYGQEYAAGQLSWHYHEFSNSIDVMLLPPQLQQVHQSVMLLPAQLQQIHQCVMRLPTQLQQMGQCVLLCSASVLHAGISSPQICTSGKLFMSQLGKCYSARLPRYLTPIEPGLTICCKLCTSGSPVNIY